MFLDMAEKEPVSSQPQRLPSGRHGLAPSFVASNQRERIMAAVAGSVSARGYAGMTVEDVISLAGVSRRTFYDHFKSKEDAFLVAYDGVCVQLYELVLGAYTRAPNDFERLRDSIDTFLRFLATEPAFADMCIVEVLAAGPKAIERRDHLMRDFAAMFDAAGRGLSEDDIPPPLTAEAIVGGIYEVVYKRVLRGTTASLPELVPELLYFGVVPYMGRDAAKARFVSTRAGRDGTAR